MLNASAILCNVRTPGFRVCPFIKLSIVDCPISLISASLLIDNPRRWHRERIRSTSSRA